MPEPRGVRPLDPPIGTCDWGSCDADAADWRWDDTHGWLPVCEGHEATGTLSVLSNVAEAIAALPEAEQRRYRECQQSVIDARRSAERNEGQRYIG